MATPTNYIGPFPFVSLRGGPRVPTMRVEPFTRSGVNGTGFFLHGVSGLSFVLRSFADAASYDDAKQLAVDYQAALGAGVTWLIQDNLNWTSQGVGVVVLHVEERQTHFCAGPGFLVPTAGAFTECDWTLISVAL